MDLQEGDAIRWSPLRAETLTAAVDFVVASLCVIGLRVVATAPAAEPRAWTIAGLGLAAALLLWLHRLGHYERRQPLVHEIGDLLGAGVVLAAIDLGLALLAGMRPAAAILCWGTALILLPLGRFGLRRWLDDAGLWQRPTVLVGTGARALDTARALMAAPSMGLSVVAFAEPRPRTGRGDEAGGLITVDGAPVPVMAVEQLFAGELGTATPYVVIAPEADEMSSCLDLLERLAAAGCDVDFVPPLGDLPVTETRLASLVGGEVTALRLRDPIAAPFSRLYKRTFDLIVGGALLVFAAPLLGVIAAAIVAIDGRPVFFRQGRVGLYGRPFACLKFRTMAPDAEARLHALLARDPAARAEWQRDRKLKDDPRISRTGHWLRRTSLDELPQLINVVRGDMSLIGPRPVVEEELARYGARAALYLKTRPGLSGLWQVSGRNDVDYERRVDLDCHYVRHWTPWWDVALLLATVRVVFSRRGAY